MTVCIVLELSNAASTSFSNQSSGELAMEDNTISGFSQERAFDSFNAIEEDATPLKRAKPKDVKCSDDKILPTFPTQSTLQVGATEAMSRRSSSLISELQTGGLGLDLLVRTVSKKFPINKGIQSKITIMG